MTSIAAETIADIAAGRGRSFWLAFLLCLLFASPQPVGAQTAGAIGEQVEASDAALGSDERPIRVGTKLAPPFVIRAPDGALGGISIDLWEHIAQRNGWQFRYEERDLDGLLAGVADGSLDLAVAALTITADRERMFDFSHPFHTTGLAIATRAEQSASIGAVLKRLFSMQFLRAIAGLGLLLFVVGVLVWYAERRRNPEEFGGPVLRGIGSGFWWSAVTMTTVGYGDKSPRTFVGRAIALVWMFAAIILISGVTAAITTALTVSSLEGRVRGPDDLSRVNVGALRGTTGNEWLTGAFVSHTDYADMASGLRALQVGDIDAFVHDAPLLRYQVHERYAPALRIVPGTFTRQDYAIAAQEGSVLMESMNRALIERISDPSWQQVLSRYLGDAR